MAHEVARRGSPGLSAPLALLLALLVSAAAGAERGEHVVQSASAELYVAPSGNDAWSGSLPAPRADGTDGPFATLERARDALRKLRAGKPSRGPVVVRLRGGTYRRAKPFVLHPEDSGTESSPVVYESSPGEKAILSGGRPIAGWRKGNGPLWTVELPDVKAREWVFRQLFVNGKRRERPRFPKQGMLKLAHLPKLDASSWMAASTQDKGKLAKRAFQYRAGDIRADWANLDDVEVVVLQFWMEARLRIQHVDEKNRVVLFTGGSWRPLTWSRGYYVENVFEGLDTPGTWYLDRRKGVLHYHPLPGEDMARAEVVAPAAEQLVRLEGDAAAGKLVHHVTLRGLTFCHTQWPLPAEGFGWPQGELPPPAAIHADGARDCRIEQCKLTHLGAWGVELRRGCTDNAIVANTMSDFGAGAVKIGEPKNCERDAEETCRTLVADNRLTEGGQVYLGAPCIWIGQSSGNTVSHNEIAGPFMWGVSVGWTWSYFPLQRARDNVIEFNHIHHLGTGILGTHGAIYALGTSPGTVIRNNHIHHILAPAEWGSGEGIILDNGCAGILVENNVVHHADAGGFGTNYNCFGNVIVNNIFAYGTKYQLTVYGDQPTGRPQPKGELFARNIVVWREGPLIKEKDWPDFRTLWDYNLYFREGGKPVTFLSGRKLTLEQWQAQGLGRHSVVADPLFVDPKAGDFSLKPGSPALKLGFQPIDISTVGPRDAGRRHGRRPPGG